MGAPASDHKGCVLLCVDTADQGEPIGLRHAAARLEPTQIGELARASGRAVRDKEIDPASGGCELIGFACCEHDASPIPLDSGADSRLASFVEIHFRARRRTTLPPATSNSPWAASITAWVFLSSMVFTSQ